MTTEGTTPRQIMGTITEDPLLALPVGAKIDFSSELFTSDAPGGLNDIDNWGFFDGVVIGLLFGDSLSKHILGSGVMVAPGVALAAKHVVEPQTEPVVQGERGFICAGILSSGSMIIWRPRHVTMVDSTDLALLTLECASPLPEILRHATISTRLPWVGERIFIAGVRHEVEADGEAAGLGVRMMVAAGVVLDRYELRRDQMLPWPTLAVDCPALSGMSGGPAFDERGFLIGLLSSSSDGEQVAYVSLLWPSLTTKVTPPWPPGLYQAPMSLLEMDRRLCGIERPDALEIVRGGSDGNDQVIYRPWDG